MWHLEALEVGDTLLRGGFVLRGGRMLLLGLAAVRGHGIPPSSPAPTAAPVHGTPGYHRRQEMLASAQNFQLKVYFKSENFTAFPSLSTFPRPLKSLFQR